MINFVKTTAAMNRRTILYSCIAIVVLALAMFVNDSFLKKREFVIVSTNDIHSTIDNFARLATLVQRCRDTVETVVLDAGDRWPGSSYVDLAEGRRPILDLMGDLGLYAGTLGNHAFDMGPKFIDDAMKYSRFQTVCCNIHSDTVAMEDPMKFTTLRLRNGLKLFISGVVSTADNGHPEGATKNFRQLTFSDPIESAHSILKNSGGCDMRILLSHMGDTYDCRYASTYGDYDFIVSGHTHVLVDTLINGVTIGQTGYKLKRCGVTRVSFRGRKMESIRYQNIDLSEIPQDSVFQQAVEKIKNNPELKRKVGSMATDLNFAGVVNFVTSVIRDATASEIGVYHYGGIRIKEIPAGDVPLCTASDLDPFHSQIIVLTMTPAQLRKAILTKYNDTGNIKESHRLDMLSTVPYTIVTDRNDNGTDVIFPTLNERKTYRIAFSDYIVNQYQGLEYSSRIDPEIFVVDALNEMLEKHSPLRYSCEEKQKKIVR